MSDQSPKPAGASVISREEAAQSIATALKDHTHFIATVPPGMAGDAAELLEGLPGFVMMLDQGMDTVLTTSSAAIVAATDGLAARQSAAVALVPKTVGTTAISECFGQEIPDDGSQDILNLSDDGDVAFPTLFIDAVDLVDPLGAAQMRGQGRPIS
ncbi:hypothetical protein DN069_31165 [Streptacidiphilus pinicola]|uniref:Uncharacterized protein n=1 Tax=Streptacidiphilus pinicola TaxID=2219663 RepID=A0A2X0I9W3_9ACTN|nr:hypothetical protein [Streptacidiphilus pinicola]RAG81762.1 hypothetical protein DN069_31165 [Streptacidiphilus pinicola]